MYIERDFIPPKKESYFLFGPRGTGKTTWLKKTYQDALWIDLLNPQEERIFSMYPEKLKERINANPTKKIVIIDEVQKVPKILDVVHELIENKIGLQFILTGSSARKLRKAGVNLLAGRALWRNFYPFMGIELKNLFDLSKALKTGLIPLIWSSENPEDKLEAYVNLYLQEEVKAEALVRELGNFSRFLEVMSYSHASLINLSNISRECEVPRKTVESYFQILQDLLLGYTINVFEKRAQRELSSHPKFYFFDPGVFRFLRKKGFLDQSSEIEGAALEGLVAEHLKNFLSGKIQRGDLYFWRTRSGLEVDFILYGENLFYAIEVKNNHMITSQTLRGLKEFSLEYPEAKPILLHRGNEILKKDNVLCLPIENFFKNLDPSKEFENSLIV